MLLRRRLGATKIDQPAVRPLQSPTRLADHFGSLSVSPRKGEVAPRRSARVATSRSSSTSVSQSNSLRPTPRKRRKLNRAVTDDTSASKVARGERRDKRSIGRPLGKPDPLIALQKTHDLPGREQECDLLYEKLSDALRTQQGCCIYISGVPGTGKTATLRQTIHNLRASSEVGSFGFVEINGMKLADPSQTYSLLWEYLSGRKASGTVALHRLSKHFETSPKQRPPLIVLLDELDLLLRKKSSILYHFFEWTGWSSSRLIVVAIANTMDLPERLLPNRIASRMGTNRLNFKPYTYPQLMAIIAHRLARWKHLFHPDALEYCARKVSSVSGDARRALALAKRAIDWVQRTSNILITGSADSGLIKIPLMDQAFKMTLAGNPVELMRDLALHSKYMLLAALLAARAAGTTYISFGQVCENHWQLLRASSLVMASSSSSLPSYSTLTMPIPFNQLQTIFSHLENARLLVRQQHRPGSIVTASSMARLGIPEEEIIMAFKDMVFFQKYLTS